MPLVHPVLPTKYNIYDMDIGDAISCEYTALNVGTIGTFANLGTAEKELIPPDSSATPNGSFFFNKVYKGLLIADRYIQHSISWDAINGSGFIEGKLYSTIPEVQTITAIGDYDTGRDLYKLTEDSLNTYNTLYYLSVPVGNEYVQYDYVNPVNINNIGIKAVTGAGMEPINTFKLTGSNDNFSTETELISETYTDFGNLQNYSFDNTQEFISYRLYLLSWYADNGADGSNLDRLILKYISKSSLIRSITGGIGYLDSNGNMSLTNQGLGVYPYNNEWDKYILNSTLLGQIIPGDNAIWNIVMENGWSYNNYCKETPANGVETIINSTTYTGSNSRRVTRGFGTVDNFNHVTSDWSGVDPTNKYYGCFRPVLQYKEDGSLIY